MRPHRRLRDGARLAIDDDREAAEPVASRPLEQLEPALRVARRGPPRHARTSAAAIARSAPGSASSAESASISPAAASALAAGGIPSRSAIARSSACSRSLAERARSATSSRSVAAARAAAAASFARASSSAGAGPPRRAIARASASSLRERLGERGGRFLPQRQPLARRAERDEPAVGAFLAARRVGERRLDAAPRGRAAPRGAPRRRSRARARSAATRECARRARSAA